MSWLIKLVLFLLVLLYLRTLFLKLLGIHPKQRKQSAAAGVEHRRMVRDPYCGMYISIDLALPDHSTGNLLYFCTEKCRDHFLSKIDKDEPIRREGSSWSRQ